MSLSKHLQRPDMLAAIRGRSAAEVRDLFLREGEAWYSANPAERERIRTNLAEFGFAHDSAVVAEFIRHVALHYYEKLVPLAGDVDFYHQLLTTAVDLDSAAAAIEEARAGGKGILLAAAHFGAVEFVVPSLATRKLPITAVLKFKTEQFSAMARERVRRMAAGGLFGEIRFIEIGRPGTNAALDMAAVLRRKEVLLSVFDEKTDYSVPASLLGRQVWGGAGLDRLIRFAGTSAAVYNAFMTREDSATYRLDLHEVDPRSPNAIDQMYLNLERVVKAHPEQWYFLHEEIPFITRDEAA